jgi:hypothetical protein
MINIFSIKHEDNWTVLNKCVKVRLGKSYKIEMQYDKNTIDEQLAVQISKKYFETIISNIK